MSSIGAMNGQVTVTVGEWLAAYRGGDVPRCASGRCRFEIGGKTIFGSAVDDSSSSFRLFGHPNGDATELVTAAISAMERTESPFWRRPAVPGRFLPELGNLWRLYSENPILTLSGIPPITSLAYQRLRDVLSPSNPEYETVVSQIRYIADRFDTAIELGYDIPGGLVDISLVEGLSVYVMGDVHANAAGLLNVLNIPVEEGMTLIEAMARGRAIFMLTGDFFLPFIGRFERTDHAMRRAVYTIDLVVSLLALFPDNFIVTQGNHDGLRRAIDLATGGRTLRILREVIYNQRGSAYVKALQTLTERLPLAANIPDVAVVGHTPVVDMTRNEVITAPFNPRRLYELTYGRVDPEAVAQNIAAARHSWGSQRAIYVTGHRDIPYGVPGSAYEPHPGVVTLQATRRNISGVKISGLIEQAVTVVDLIGEETSPLAGVDLRRRLLQGEQDPARLPVRPAGSGIFSSSHMMARGAAVFNMPAMVPCMNVR